MLRARDRLIRLAAGWGAIAGLGLLLNGRLQADLMANAWRLLEAGMILGLLLCLAAHRSLSAALGTVRGTRAIALLGLLGLVAVAQVIDKTRATYPFLSWSMYSEPEVMPTYVEYKATLASGRVIDFPFHEIVPTFERRSVSHGLTRRLARRSQPPGHLYFIEEAERLIESLAKIYNARHPSDQIEHVEVRYRAVPLQEFEGPASIRSRHIASYAISSVRQ